jgi:hypothetical protein
MLFERGLLKAFKLVFLSFAILSLALARPSYSGSLSLTVATSNSWYAVGTNASIAGSVSNGSAIPNALVFFEVDTPKGNPLVIRTLTTGQTPSPPPGGWPVELLNVTPSDSSGNPVYSFQSGQDAGFKIFVRNNSGTSYQVVITINLFFYNGVPFLLQTIFNGTLQAGQTLSSLTWPVNIPANSLQGQAMVCASVFTDYPKNNGYPFSPEQSAVFNITSGIPAQVSPSSTLGTFNLTLPLEYIPETASVWLGNYTIYGVTHYPPFLGAVASNQLNFTVKLIGDFLGNGIINMVDVAHVARAFGTYAGGPGWNATYDLTGPIPYVPDGKIDMRDVALIAKEFGTVAIP